MIAHRETSRRGDARRRRHAPRRRVPRPLRPVPEDIRRLRAAHGDGRRDRDDRAGAHGDFVSSADGGTDANDDGVRPARGRRRRGSDEEDRDQRGPDAAGDALRAGEPGRDGRDGGDAAGRVEERGADDASGRARAGDRDDERTDGGERENGGGGAREGSDGREVGVRGLLRRGGGGDVLRRLRLCARGVSRQGMGAAGSATGDAVREGVRCGGDAQRTQGGVPLFGTL